MAPSGTAEAQREKLATEQHKKEKREVQLNEQEAAAQRRVQAEQRKNEKHDLEMKRAALELKKAEVFLFALSRCL